MAEDFELFKDLQPVDGLVFDSLSRNSAYWGVLMLYLKLLRDADGRLRSNKQLASFLGTSEATIKRNLRLLRKLGLVAVDGARQTRTLLVTTHYSTLDDRLPRVLKGIASGRVVLEEGRVIDAKTEREFDAETLRLRVMGDPKVMGDPTITGDPTVIGDPTTAVETESVTPSEQTSLGLSSQNGSTPVLAEREFSHISSSYNRSRSTKNSISTRINKTLCMGEFYNATETDKKSPYWLPVTADYLPLKSRFNPGNDPFRAAVEAVQAHANETFGVKHSVFDGAGRPNERYGILFRALSHYSFTEDQLKAGIDNTLKHHFWSTTNVRDTLKLFRKLDTAEDLVNYRAPLHQKVDMRHLELREVRGPKIISDFEF